MFVVCVCVSVLSLMFCILSPVPVCTQWWSSSICNAPPYVNNIQSVTYKQPTKVTSKEKKNRISLPSEPQYPQSLTCTMLDHKWWMSDEQVVVCRCFVLCTPCRQVSVSSSVILQRSLTLVLHHLLTHSQSTSSCMPHLYEQREMENGVQNYNWYFILYFVYGVTRELPIT